MIIFLQNEILNQKIIRTLNLCENFKKYSQNWNEEKKNEEIKQIEKMIKAKRDLKALEKYIPQILIFEYQNNIILREKQIQILSKICEFYENQKLNSNSKV
ncbi:hypothetical protein M0811_12836 [Anaeramoeba ignava]|uniref:Uncharacterized protein n=1 Tax=Anaeramoeba ignava TaxID=1746090 RepID=A0A9Q0R652_ANAIG|nr:hypothetical protein M0811_12836 [Anaeramoeba ignava]